MADPGSVSYTHLNGIQMGQESTMPKADAAKTGDCVPIVGIIALTIAAVSYTHLFWKDTDMHGRDDNFARFPEMFYPFPLK